MLQAQFTDEIMKALAESDAEEEHNAKKPEVKPEPKKEEPKKEAKKDEKKEEKDDSVPMDNNAIKAYASVIADAAEDSEPATPVVYAAVDVDSGSSDQRMKKAPM